MTCSCPLPVDWLDHLDGEGEPGLAEHLAGCRSCRALVASLREHAPATIPAEWCDALAGRTDAVWHEDRPATPAPAEFWFSAPDFTINGLVVGEITHGQTTRIDYRDIDRVLLLVLTPPDQDRFGWLDVVPVRSDIEAATETDLLFAADENTLGAPWRALFAHQVKVARGQLDTRVGWLSDVGVGALLAALDGEADDERWGVPLQHPDDPRAQLDAAFETVLRRLREPWLQVHHGGDDEATGEDPPGVWVVAPELEHAGERELAGVLWLTPVGESQHAFPLAAASAPLAAKDEWALRQDRLELTGTLGVDWQLGLLVFVIASARLRDAGRVRLHVVAAGRHYASEPFVPAQNTTVPLAEAVMPAEVDRLGAEVLC